jgi:hypothetical protein
LAGSPGQNYGSRQCAFQTQPPARGRLIALRNYSWAIGIRNGLGLAFWIAFPADKSEALNANICHRSD